MTRDSDTASVSIPTKPGAAMLRDGATEGCAMGSERPAKLARRALGR